MSNKKGIHFISLGCPKNRVDAETMLLGSMHKGVKSLEILRKRVQWS